MAKDIQTFNRTNLQGLRGEMDQALNYLAEKYGIKISTGNVSFLDNEATFKVKLNTISDGGTVITKEATDWVRYRGIIGMAHLNIGDTIYIQGNRYTLSGYKRRASRRPIMFKDTKGQQFVCSEQMLSNENSK